MTVELRSISGPDILPVLGDLARLRITVFRDWPYLYDGSMDYERRYLAAYAEDPEALVVGAFDGDHMVGASTATALVRHADDFRAAFKDTGIALNDVYYLAESVLLPAYRGRGLGHAFFDAREAHARRLGFPMAAFCAIQRPSDHPSRPTDYRPLDLFWKGRGYRPLPGVVASFDWRDVGDTEQTTHELQFWARSVANGS